MFGYFIVFVSMLLTALMFFQVSLLQKGRQYSREEYQAVQEQSVLSCRDAVLNFFSSHKPPFNFELPIERICGGGYSASKSNCDSYYCDYDIFLSDRKVFRITKSMLSLMVEGVNVERARMLADSIIRYARGFHDGQNHFLDIGETDGFQDVIFYRDFFEENDMVPFTDVFADELHSNFQICTTNCDRPENDTAVLRYTSPYTGKSIDLLLSLKEGT